MDSKEAISSDQHESGKHGTDRINTLNTTPTSYSQSERHVRRKLDRHLLPLVVVLYLLAFLDRSNIGNARIAGMADRLELVGTRYDWLLTIFYISYILFDWMILLWKVFPPHIVGTACVFIWGLLSVLQAATQNWSGMMALRFFLGIAETAYAPGIIYLFSFFYLRDEIGIRCGIFVSAAPLASTFAGALAYGITSGHSKLANWRLLFLVEGIPTLLVAPFVYFFLPDSPDKARFLNVEEKAIAKARMVRQAGYGERTGIDTFVAKDVLRAMADPKAWITAIMYFSANVSYASLPVFLPTILEDMGYTKINAQGLSAPPNFAACFAAVGMAWLADKYQQRGFALVFSGIVGGVGYLILATVSTVGVRYFATFLAAAGVFSTIPNINAWVLNNQGTDTRRGAGLVLLNLIGQCGPLLGTRIFPLAQRPNYIEGMSICAAFMFFAALLALVLRLFLVRENKKLDLRYGKAEDLDAGARKVAAENSDNPTFRFTL